MIKHIFTVLLITFSSLSMASSLDYDSIWKCDANKFNWYCDMQTELLNEKKDEQKEKKPISIRIEIKDIKTAEQMRAELKRREDIAVMEPSDKNLRDYLELWQATQEKGAVFADSWRRVVWKNPDLDYSLKRPVNNTGIRTYDANRSKSQDQSLKDLAQHHGLVFFFRSDCPYCHAMAPTLRQFSLKTGIEILPVSVDGGGLPDFPNPTDGRAQASKWGIERVPALFIASKETGDKAAIGFGVMSLDEIIDRIFVLTQTKPGQNF